MSVETRSNMSNLPKVQSIAYHFLVLPEFSYLGLLCAIEPLRIANHFRSESYTWRLLSVDGGPVVATNGMMLQTEGSFADKDRVQQRCAANEETGSV